VGNVGTYRLWRDTGLLGYDAADQPDPSWRGRNDGRNAAFTDLLFSSGLRLREGGCLLTIEVPDAAGGHGYYEGTVAGAVAKRRQRMFYASAAALRRVAAYVATTRADAARRHRRYEQVTGKLIVTRIGHGARPRLAWRDERGRAADGPLGANSPEERMRLFTEGEDGLGPLWLWLGESGMPMAYESWEKVFDAADPPQRAGRGACPAPGTGRLAEHRDAVTAYVIRKLHATRKPQGGPAIERRSHMRLRAYLVSGEFRVHRAGLQRLPVGSPAQRLGGRRRGIRLLPAEVIVGLWSDVIAENPERSAPPAAWPA
jgi:hypothetical protein